MRRLILAAALAAASMSYALAPAAYAEAVGNNEADAAGVDTLGIDLTGVNISPAGVHAYMAQQSPRERRVIENACSTYDTHPTMAGEETLAFCADLGKA
ncbi:MAG TPA: hypothetical protein VHA70_04205 [Bauldia sp.]|nr:hypothetical protein [Bauldia sp.]